MQSVVESASPFASESSDVGRGRDWVAVSFNFSDLAWCDWLYREFDGERIPRPLQGRPSRDGLPYPERISVTPDPADSDQLAGYAEALESAQHLVIVVSPNSGDDPLLCEHRRIFKAAGGEQRMIALVVKGEPASPAAEPADERDYAWLPKWLAWRFEKNRFKAAGIEEPLVVDARLGISSLAEVRMKLLAAMLEVPVSQLPELGVVSRATTDVRDLPAPSSARHSSPESVSAAAMEPVVPVIEQGSSTLWWPLVLCGMGAVAAMGFLAFGPAAAPKLERAEIVHAPRLAQTPSGHALDQPVVAVETLDPEPLPDFSPSEPQPPKPAAQATAAGATSSITPEMTPQERIVRDAAVLGAKRDRLSAEAEMSIRDGSGERAMALYADAIGVASEITALIPGDGPSQVASAALHRKIGHLALNLSSTAEARAAYEQGRRVLISLRGRGALPAEGVALLREIESAIRSLPRD